MSTPVHCIIDGVGPAMKPLPVVCTSATPLPPSQRIGGTTKVGNTPVFIVEGVADLDKIVVHGDAVKLFSVPKASSDPKGDCTSPQRQETPLGAAAAPVHLGVGVRLCAVVEKYQGTADLDWGGLKP